MRPRRPRRSRRSSHDPGNCGPKRFSLRSSKQHSWNSSSRQARHLVSDAYSFLSAEITAARSLPIGGQGSCCAFSPLEVTSRFLCPRGGDGLFSVGQRRSASGYASAGLGCRWSFRPELTCLEDRTVPSAYTVTNNFDSVVGGVPVAGSLRAAVAAVDDGLDNTINFAGVLRSPITLNPAYGELLITNNVTINGPGANKLSVSGNNATRVFELAPPPSVTMNVAISNLTISHGYALDQGGGILNDGSNLTLSGDDLLQNVAYENTIDTNGANGGAIESNGGNLNITGCTIANNQALGGAGASATGLAFGGGINDRTGKHGIVRATSIQGNRSPREAQGASTTSLAGGGASTPAARLRGSSSPTALSATTGPSRGTSPRVHCRRRLRRCRGRRS